MQEFIRSLDYSKENAQGEKERLCLGVSFEDSTAKKWEYTIHMNNTQREGRYDFYSNDEAQIIAFKKEDTDTFEPNLSHGGPYLMSVIDNLILQKDLGSADASITANLLQTPVSSYKTSNAYDIGNGSIPIFIAFSLIVIYLRFVYSITIEKEHRITENMRNMGMNMFSHYMSWILWYFFTLFLTSIPMTIILKLSMYSEGNILLVWLMYFLPGAAMISWGFLASSLFVNAKPAVLTALILFFIFYGMRIATNILEANLSEFYMSLMALSPIVMLDKISRTLLIVQANYATFGFSMVTEVYFSYRYITFLFTAIGEIFFCCLLGMWIDQVIPSEIGVKKHPLFCLGFRTKEAKAIEKVGEVNALKRSFSNFEDIGEAEKAQKKNNKSLEVENLTKVYSNGKLAVKNLNLSMYSDQIFALLGHNGAGKTTTISMISGLLPLSSGKITILGNDSKTNMDKIKSFMGVCPQKNPIYETLTVYEHLKLYANIKNNKDSSKNIEEEIDELLHDIDLFDKKNYFAGRLSGGQKRKLCVAISFIGGSSVILLDEPTSGMDTYARRRLWDMLKKYKKGRVIILTTHYMDEADYLGDRIGIMGDGELLTCGTPFFLKDKFGVGYNLTVVKSSSEKSTDNLTKAIQSIIPTSHLEGDIGKELKYILPNNDISKFEDLFRKLETQKEELGIQSFGISLTTLEEVFLKVAIGLGNQESIDQMKIEMNKDPATEVELQKIRIQSKFTLFCVHFNALLKKRFIYFGRDIKGIICEIVLPIAIILIGMLVTLISFIKDVPGWNVEPGFLPQPYEVWVGNDIMGFSDSLKTPLESYIPKIVAREENTLAGFNDALMKNEVDKRFWDLYGTKADTTKHQYEYYGFYNVSVPNSIFVAQKQGNLAAYRKAMGDKSAYIKTNLAAFPITKQLEGFTGSISGFFAVFFIVLAFSFIPSSNIMFIVMERENNVKHQQLVSGIGLMAYWLSNLVVDFAKYLIVAAATVMSLFLYNVETFTSGAKLVMALLLIALFGLSMSTFTYLTSFLFKSPSSAQIFTFVFNFLCGFVLMILSFMLRLIDSTRSFHFNYTEFLLRLFPMFNFSFGMLNMAYDLFYYLIFELSAIPGPFSRYGSLYEFLALIVNIVVYFALIFVVEGWSWGEKETPKNPNSTEENRSSALQKDGEESDVWRERRLVHNEEKDGEFQHTDNRFAVKVKEIGKTYYVVEGGGCGKKAVTAKKAVKGVSFGVEKGDCFGLLGTNGAGKSTTFKMLCGEIMPSHGFAYIEGVNVATDMKRIRHLIGYCPQFDALLDNLTSRQHLELYAAIKGIPAHMREPLIKEKLQQLNLTNFEHVQAGTYSGGNKRKLSVAIALLGNPPIVFLDEPSSGMDPEARRFMWSVVSRITSGTKKSSVILTTHSMEEAEALSTKLAIMVEGDIKCIGPITSLKAKYGKGFEIECKLSLPTIEQTRVISERGRIPLPAKMDEEGEQHSEDPVLKEDELRTVLNNLGKPNYIDKVTSIGDGSSIFNEVIYPA